jgi:hypothetical protein
MVLLHDDLLSYNGYASVVVTPLHQWLRLLVLMDDDAILDGESTLVLEMFMMILL